jgi:hypothetical protein
MSTLMQDVRYTIRLLAKQSAFTAVIIVSLALGMGANTMMFGLLLFYCVPCPTPNQTVWRSYGLLPRNIRKDEIWLRRVIVLSLLRSIPFLSMLDVSTHSGSY